ncbi:MAG: hypothetical protein ABSG43_31370 [Solirubrobacteraceae bacterium]|jgi:hypothetical protein
MTLIDHNNIKPWAALASPLRASLHPDLERLPDEHPDKRWVLAKCVWAMRIDAQACESENWQWEDVYRDQDAAALIRPAHAEPAKPFRANCELPDEQLAARFRVPVAKVAARRVELAADQHRPRAGRVCEDVHDPSVCELTAALDRRAHRRAYRRSPRR